MKVVLLLVAVMAVTASASSAVLKPLTAAQAEMLFTSWTKQHGKVYATTEEMFKRYTIFRTNMEVIRQHNADETNTFTVAMNEFGDLTNEEFSAMYNNYVHMDNSFLRAKNIADLSDVAVPESVDWAAAGKVYPVKDQGQCGSCWAFSAIGAVEAAYAIEQNTSPISLSEQELVDCGSSTGNHGCQGGWMDSAFTWIINNKGICNQTGYPYTARDGKCNTAQCTSQVSISGFKDVQANSEVALQAAVAQQPVSVAVDAGGYGWQFYSGGVMTASCGTSLNHGVLAAGYGTLNGTPYWQVKNSWGTSWGQKGYILLKRGNSTNTKGECGIAMVASFPYGTKKV